MRFRITDLYVKTLLIIIGLMLFCTVLFAVFFDQRAFESVSSARPEFIENTFVHAFRQLGKAWVPIWLLLVWAWLKKNQKPVVTGLLGLILLAPSVAVIKAAVQRPRPIHIINNTVEDSSKPNWRRSWSFPSGDTATVFVVTATSCAFINKISLKLLLFAVSSAVGIFRVFSLHHFPSDICGGVVVGLSVGILALHISKKMFRADPNQHPYFANDYALIFILSLPLVVTFFERYNPLGIFLKIYGLPLLIVTVLILIKQKRIPFFKIGSNIFN